MNSIWKSSDQKVKKEIIKEGTFSSKPGELSVCNIYVNNPQSFGLSIKQLQEGLHSKIIDEESKKVIVIGEADSKVDREIERAIQMMSLHEQSLITVKIEDKNILPTLVSLEVTLESIDFHKPIWEWTPEEKYTMALKWKENGVQLFREKRYVDAFYKFSKACKILITLEPIEEESDPILIEVVKLKYILYNNMAECQLLRENNEHVITLCNKVLNKDKNNVKALYRRGVAYGGLKDFEKASNDLKNVITLEPKDKKAQEKYNDFKEKWHASVQGYENIVRKMFKF